MATSYGIVTPIGLKRMNGTRMLEKGRQLSPGFRGAFYYAGFYAVIGVITPFLNVYFSELGLDGRQIGLLGMLPPLFQMFFTPFYSGLADRRGQRALMLGLSLSGAGAAYLLLGFSRSFFAILVVMALVSMFAAPSNSLSDALVARMASRHRIDFGRMRLGGSIGYAIFSVIAGLVWQRTGYGWMFPAAMAIYLLVALIAQLLDELPAPKVTETRALPWREVGRHPILRTLLVATFLVGGAMMMSLTFNGIYMRYLGGGDAIIGLQVGLGAIAEIPFMFFTQRIMRRIGGLNTLLLGYTFFGLSFLGTALATTPLALLLVTLVRGPGFALFMVTTVVLLDRYAGEWSATTQSMMNATAFGLAPLIASPMGGFIYDLLGPSRVFLACSLMVLAAMAILYVGLVWRRPKGITERI